MNGWWLLVVVLAVLGVILLAAGFVQMLAARPTREIKGGFGGPAGSSDIGGGAGFDVPGPRDHWKAGAPMRILGIACLGSAAILAAAQAFRG